MRSLLALLSLGILTLSGCTTTEVGNPDKPMTKSKTAAADADQIFTMPYRLETLDNDLKVLIVKTDFPDIVSLQIPVQTGSRNEVEPGKSGFAHFFEHLLFEGTKNIGRGQWDKIVSHTQRNQ